MTQIHISNRLLRDFGMVPNALWSAPLPLAAKAVAAYLLSLRDGEAMPYVAAIEATLGIGRDARRKAFAALEAAGFLSWEYSRDARGAICRKTLRLDPFAFAAPVPVAGSALSARDPVAAHAPESQADGRRAGVSDHAPDLPAGGFPAPVAAEIRPCGDGGSGGLSKTRQDKKARAARARQGVQPRRSPLDSGGGASSTGNNRAKAGAPVAAVADLTPFQRGRIVRGASVLVDSRLVAPGTAEFSALAAALAASGAGL